MKLWKSLAVLVTLMVVSVGCTTYQETPVVLIEPTYSYLRDEPTLSAIDTETASRLDKTPTRTSRVTIVE